MNFSSPDVAYTRGTVGDAAAVGDDKDIFQVDSFSMGVESTADDVPTPVVAVGDDQTESSIEYTFDDLMVSSVNVGGDPGAQDTDSGGWVDIQSFSQPVYQPGASASDEPPLDGVTVFADSNQLGDDAASDATLQEDGLVGPPTEDPLPPSDPGTTEYILDPVVVASYTTGGSEAPVPDFGLEDVDESPTLVELAPSAEVGRSGVGGDADVAIDDVVGGVGLDDIVDG